MTFSPSNPIHPPLWGVAQSQYLNLWFIRLRWIASGVALALVFLTIKVLHYMEEEVLWPLVGLIGLLAITNLVYLYLMRKGRHPDRLKLIQIVWDLFILTLMLHYSGGIENPLSFVYLFHVILSGILLNKKRCYGVVVLAFLLYSSLAMLELNEVVPHYTLDIFPHKIAQTDDMMATDDQHDEHDHHSENGIHAAHYPVYVWSMSLLTLFILLLTAYFITNIMTQLRAEETKSREERQRLEHVLQSTGAGLLILNESLKPIWFNEPAKNWLGLIEGNDGSKSAKLAAWLNDKEVS